MPPRLPGLGGVGRVGQGGKLVKGMSDPNKPKRIRIRKRDVSSPTSLSSAVLCFPDISEKFVAAAWPAPRHAVSSDVFFLTFAEDVWQMRAWAPKNLLSRLRGQGNLPPQSHSARVQRLQGQGTLRAQSSQDHVSTAYLKT
jgi:hypothetical protein